MRGIILAGGAGTRLHPLTLATSKQLLPVFDKPLIFHPLSTLILAGATEILLLTTPEDASAFHRLLGDGSRFGIELVHAVQPEPRGIAEAFTLAPAGFRDQSCCLILGDNLLHGPGLGTRLQRHGEPEGAVIFGYEVADPRRYGVIELDAEGRAVSLVEKPTRPRSRLAVPGIYFYDTDVFELAGSLRPSARGELEITDLNNLYLDQGRLRVEPLPRGTAWLDVGTFEALSDAGQLVQTLQQRQGLLIGSPEEAAWRQGLIDDEQLLRLAEATPDSGYGRLLRRLLGDGADHDQDRADAVESASGGFDPGDRVRGVR